MLLGCAMSLQPSRECRMLGQLNLMYCLIYLDDVIVFSKTEEEHL